MSINILPNGLQVNIVKSESGLLESGRYIASEFKLNYDADHLSNIHEALQSSKFLKFFKRGVHQVTITSDDTSISFKIYSKIPSNSRYNLSFSSKENFAFYQDIVDIRYDGDPRPTYEVVKDVMKFQLPDSASLDEPQDVCYNYPEAVLWDMLEFITVLAGTVLTNGFEEAILIGPNIVEIE